MAIVIVWAPPLIIDVKISVTVIGAGSCMLSESPVASPEDPSSLGDEESGWAFGVFELAPESFTAGGAAALGSVTVGDTAMGVGVAA